MTTITTIRNESNQRGCHQGAGEGIEYEGASVPQIHSEGHTKQGAGREAVFEAKGSTDLFEGRDSQCTGKAKDTILMSKFILGDCMDPDIGIPSYPDYYFDLVIADPPYGIDYQSSRRTDSTKRHKKIANDDRPFVEWINCAYEKMNDRGRLICFYRYDVQNDFLTAIYQSGFKVKGQGIWDKVIHGMGDLNGSIALQHEPFLYATKGRYEFTGNRPKSLYRATRDNAEDMIHPNQKPLLLYRMLLRDFGNQGENLLDPFGGSASSLIAFDQEGFE